MLTNNAGQKKPSIKEDMPSGFMYMRAPNKMIGILQKPRGWFSLREVKTRREHGGLPGARMF